MEMAISYDLFMDAGLKSNNITTRDASYGKIKLVNNAAPEIKIANDEAIDPNINVLDIEAPYLGEEDATIHIVKSRNQKSENEIAEIKKNLMKSYMQLLSGN